MRKPTGLTPLKLVKHEGRDPPDESAPTVIHADKLSALIERTQTSDPMRSAAEQLERALKSKDSQQMAKTGRT